MRPVLRPPSLLALALAWTACAGDDTADPIGASATAATTTSSSAASTAGSTGSTATTSGTTTAGATGSDADTVADTDTAADTGSTQESDTEAGCTFLCMPDGGGPGIPECDVWEQDCKAGEKCAPYSPGGDGSWVDHKCTPVAPDPKGVGEACTVVGQISSGVDDCDVGLMCWGADPETHMGTCIAFCEGDEDTCTADPMSCCPSGQACAITNAGVLILCLDVCDPLLQACDGPGEGCYPVDDLFLCAPDVSGEYGAVGEPCYSINVCDPGSYCGEPEAYPGCDPRAQGCCIPFCSLDTPTCPPGTECTPYYDEDPPPAGYEDLGACVIPG